ncbi:MAG: hypothetical protein H7831_11365 [Magnetococcus sp. WYHC-3]
MEQNRVEEEGLSDRQRYWLDHLRCCQSEAGTITGYAGAHGLSLPSLYFWKRKLTAMGLLEGAGGVRSRFQRLELTTSSPASACRIRFPNGLTVEWSGQGGEVLTSVLRSVAAL